MGEESMRSSQRQGGQGSQQPPEREMPNLPGLLLEVSRLAASRRDLQGLIVYLVLVLRKAIPFSGLCVVLYDPEHHQMEQEFERLGSTRTRRAMVSAGLFEAKG